MALPESFLLSPSSLHCQTLPTGSCPQQLSNSSMVHNEMPPHCNSKVPGVGGRAGGLEIERDWGKLFEEKIFQETEGNNVCSWFCFALLDKELIIWIKH